MLERANERIAQYYTRQFHDHSTLMTISMAGSADRKRKMGAGGLGDLDSDDETMGTYQGSMSTVKGVSGGAEDGKD